MRQWCGCYWEKGAGVDERGGQECRRCTHEAVVEVLLGYGADVSAKDKNEKDSAKPQGSG